jgi:hypothetical protein
MTTCEITRAGTSTTLGAFWLYLESHCRCRLRSESWVHVLCAYNGHLTMALV